MWIFKFRLGPLSVNTPLYKYKIFFFCLVHAFRRPHFRFSSNRRRVSRSLHSHSLLASGLLTFTVDFTLIPIPVWKRKKKKTCSLTFFPTSKLFHCVPSPALLRVHAQHLFFAVSLLTSPPSSSGCGVSTTKTVWADKY